MAHRIKDVMSKEVVTVPETESLRSVAEKMRDRAIGDVLVTTGDRRLRGIVTDRDIVIRGLARGADPNETVGGVCSTQVRTLKPDDTVADALQVMRSHAIRRIPVVDKGVTVGIVSIGDLAQTRDPKSALGRISAAPSNT
jgi:CBS domain-containing protein